MATGHSLEHPAKDADVLQGDFIEYHDPTRATDYRKLLKHDSPPESPTRVLRAVFKSDTSPPLYYLLLYAWTRVLGTSDVSLRLLSAIASLACFPLLWWVGRQIGGTRTAIVACALFTFSPTAIYYSTEGRMYALLWFFTLGTLGLTLRMSQRGAGFGTLALWIVVAAGGLLTHYFFVFVLGAMGLWLLIHPGRACRWRIIASAMLVGLIVSVWYVRIPQSVANWRVTDYWLTVTPYGFNRVLGTMLLPWSFFTLRGVWGVRPLFDWINAAIFVALAIVAIDKLRRRLIAPSRQLLWLCIIASCAGLVIFDAWRKTYVVDCPRYALAGLPAALLLLAFAIARLKKPLYLGFTIAIVLVWLIADRRIFINPTRQTPVREVAKLITRTAQPDDLIIVSSIPSGVAGVARYMGNSIVDRPQFVSWVGQLNTRKVPDDILRLAAGHKRIILVRMHEVGAEPEHWNWLWPNTKYLNKWEIQSAHVDLFEPLNGDRF